MSIRPSHSCFYPFYHDSICSACVGF